MKIKNLIFSFFLLASVGVNAQSISLSFGASGVILPDTVTIGDTIHFSCWVVNNGNGVISDNILIEAARYDQGQGLTNIRTIGAQGPNIVSPGDSMEFVQGFLYEVVTQQHYLIGDNIVVIWPKVATPVTQTTQHIYHNMFVIGSVMSVVTPEKTNKLQFHPQPANNQIYFESNKKVLRVQLFDLLGKELNTYSLDENILNTANIESGMYLISAQFEDGTFLQNKLQITH
tara:strand:+ start:107 stop:796 length:690 start_codon:yes stop_codon:yes gene_type:complete